MEQNHRDGQLTIRATEVDDFAKEIMLVMKHGEVRWFNDGTEAPYLAAFAYVSNEPCCGGQQIPEGVLAGPDTTGSRDKAIQEFDTTGLAGHGIEWLCGGCGTTSKPEEIGRITFTGPDSQGFLISDTELPEWFGASQLRDSEGCAAVFLNGLRDAEVAVETEAQRVCEQAATEIAESLRDVPEQLDSADPSWSTWCAKVLAGLHTVDSAAIDKHGVAVRVNKQNVIEVVHRWPFSVIRHGGLAVGAKVERVDRGTEPEWEAFDAYENELTWCPTP